MKNTFNYIELIRPHQWVKNLFLFAPLFFTFKYSLEKVAIVSLGFFLFSLAASSIYIFNDYRDIDEDRQHPEKKNRPLANGTVSVKSSIFLMLVFLSIAVAGAYLLFVDFFLILLGYIALNILYTLKFKHISILDITIISIGFVLRIFAGAVLIKVEPSMWIVLITFVLALFLAMAKRRDDCILSLNGEKTRKNIDGYNLELVNSSMVFMASITVVSYIMYTVSPEIIENIGSNKLYLTTIYVIVGILRYMQITFVEEKSGSPTKIVLSDRFLQGVIVFWLFSFWALHSL